MTDNLRIALWAALAVMIYFNYQAWQQQYSQPTLPNSPALADAPSDQIIDDLPPLPDLDIDAAADRMPAVDGGTVGIRAPLITVETDVFSVDIAAGGGDLRRALLKRYPQAKDRPDVPVELLNSSSDRLFVFRTGLRAAGGRDEATHKSVYTSGRTEYSLRAGDDVLEIPLRWESPEGITVE